MKIEAFTPEQLQAAEVLAGDLTLAPTREESLKAIAGATIMADYAKAQRQWARLESLLSRIAQLKHDHLRLFGQRV